ncbi:MAG TPA: lipopolysaccharide kinase InaA family protein [Longimicrobiales bacterium]
MARITSAPLVRGFLEQHGTLYEAAAASSADSALEGRAPVHLLMVDGESWVVRHYHRGGAVARLLHDRYLRTGGSRALRELSVSVAARARGIATPIVIAALEYPDGAFTRYDIATRFISDARDLVSILFGADAVTDALLDRVVDLIQQIVQRGMMHRDLNLKNILVSTERAWVIDLDRCELRATRRTADALAMQRRFMRSLEKWQHKLGRKLPHTQCVRLEQAFHA